jgi:adenylate cyclase
MQHLLVRIRHLAPLILLTAGIALAFLFISYNRYNLGFIQQLDYYLYDARLNLTMPGDVDPTIVIVDIDEASLAEIGHWPWSRDKMARLVTELFNYYGVSLIGFDIFFREPDDSSGFRILKQLGKQELADVPQYQERLEELQSRLDFDRQFSDSLALGPVIMGYTFFAGQESNAGIQAGALPPPVITAAAVQGKFLPAQIYTGYGGNLPEIQANAAGGGHTTPALDADGVVRRVPMLIEFQGDYYESLSLAISRYILGADKVVPVFAEGGSGTAVYPDLEWLQLNDVRIPVDAHIQALVPYRGGLRSFPYVSAVDVIRGRADPQTLQGSIVLVGTSAKGLVDLRPTPVSREFPGVEIHANLISGILDQRLKTANEFTQFIGLIFILMTGLALALILPFLSPVPATIYCGAIMGAVLGMNYYFWTQTLVIPLALNLLLILIAYLMHMAYGFFFEQRAKRQLSTLFGQYLPQELVQEMSEDPTSYTHKAQNREMTVLFTDIRSFTTISEGLSPEELSAMLNDYLTPMTKIIHDHRGTIDKYIGDAVMAFWGAPLADPDHARHALYTGLAMLERLGAMREEFRARGWPAIHIGVGINTGVMSVGDMGSEFRMSYTVLGDAVNLGSRLEGLTKEYGVEIIVSQSTRAAVPDYIYRELDLVKVKGKDQPIAIYEPIAPATEVSDAELTEIELCEQAIAEYRGQDWDTAESLFRQLQEISPERALYRIYLDRIGEFRRNPPGSTWDGVYTFKTK